MNVLAQSLLHAARWLLMVVIAGLALLSARAPWLAYVNGGLLWVLLYLHVLAIPLTLNWSRRLYAPLLRGLFYFALYIVVVYAIHHSIAGVITQSSGVTHSFVDALYLSATTWTTLGYGDMAARPALRLATSMEAFTGLLTVAVITATIWLYCSDRLRQHPNDSPDQVPTLTLNSRLGVFREAETPEAIEERGKRTAKLKLSPCASCGMQPVMERYWDIVGRIVPSPKFTVECVCGEFTRPVLTVYGAAYHWNRAQRRRAKRRPQPRPDPQ